METTRDDLILPWEFDGIRISETCGGPVADISRLYNDVWRDQIGEFIVRACNSYHRRELLLQQAAGEMRYDALCVNADCAECQDRAYCIPRQIEEEIATDDLPDDVAQQAETQDDITGALEAKTREAAELKSAWDEELKRRIYAESAVRILVDHYWTSLEREGPGALCDECAKGRRGECGPDVGDSEPCDAFARAEKRYHRFSSVRKVLDRMDCKEGITLP